MRISELKPEAVFVSSMSNMVDTRRRRTHAKAVIMKRFDLQREDRVERRRIKRETSGLVVVRLEANMKSYGYGFKKRYAEEVAKES